MIVDFFCLLMWYSSCSCSHTTITLGSAYGIYVFISLVLFKVTYVDLIDSTTEECAVLRDGTQSNVTRKTDLKDSSEL